MIAIVIMTYYAHGGMKSCWGYLAAYRRTQGHRVKKGRVGVYIYIYIYIYNI